MFQLLLAVIVAHHHIFKTGYDFEITSYKLQLQACDFEMQHISGCNMASDCLSFAPMNNTSFNNNVEQFINSITTDAPTKAHEIAELINATQSDETLPYIIKFVSSRNWSKEPKYRPYYNNRETLSIYNDLLLQGHCISFVQSRLFKYTLTCYCTRGDFVGNHCVLGLFAHCPATVLKGN